MRRALPTSSLILVLCAISLGWAPPAAGQELDARMQRVVAKFVEKTGEQVMTVGSWVKGNFNPATSDFDMRLVVPAFNNATPAQQLARWQDSKRVLTTLIHEEFGTGQAGNILSRTNLYAPSALMNGIEDASEAAERFQQLKTVPSLGYSGPVNASTPVKYTEGLYGAGAPTYVQGYEKSAGRLYYWKDGKCISGLSEMAGMSEGVAEAAYTAAGSANTAGQWVEHALAEVAAGRGDKVAKYLDRLERDLTKSRSLNGLPLDQGLRSQIQDLRSLLKKDPKKLAEVSEQVTKLLSRSHTEAAILKSMGEAGPMRRVYLRIMLDGAAAGNKVGELMDKLMKQVPWANTENAMNCLVLYLGVKATSTALGEGDAMDALAASCAEFKWLSAFGPVLLGQLYSEIMIQARLGGYAMAAGSQGAWNLMEGYYTAWGRVDVDPDPRRKLTLADMVAKFQYEDRLEAVVHAQALRASTRNLGAANAQSDAGVAEAIFTKCWPVIREAWRWERDCLASEYLGLGAMLVHTPLVIAYQPNPATPGQQVICEAASFDRKLSDRLARMQQIIGILYGKGSGLAANYYWSPTGKPVGDRDWQRGFTFDKPGTYPVKVTLAVQPYTPHTQTEARVMLRREVTALVDVRVAGPTAAGGQLSMYCGFSLTGTVHRVDNTSNQRLAHTIADSCAGQATIIGNRFSASGTEDTPARGHRRWQVQGTLSADLKGIEELTIELDAAGTDTTSGRYTDVFKGHYSIRVGPLTDRGRREGSETGRWSGTGPKLCKSHTYQWTRTVTYQGAAVPTYSFDLPPGNRVEDDFRCDDAYCEFRLYSK